MTKFSALPFKWKLTLILLLTSLISVVSACAAFVGYEFYLFRHEMTREVERLAELVGSNSKQAILAKDKKGIKEAFASLANQPEVVAAAIYSKDEGILSRYLREGANETTVPFKPGALRFGLHGSSISMFRPIVSNRELVGMVYLKADFQAQMQSRVTEYANLIAIVLLVSCLVAFLISYRLQAVISRPILGLTEVARVVAGKKDYSVRAAKQTEDEVGILIDAFNNMLADIQTRDADLLAAKKKTEEVNEHLRISNEKLEEYSRTLEQKVELRTAELAHAMGEAQEARAAAEQAS